MGSDWVEVSEIGDMPATMSGVVTQEILDDELGGSVGIGGSECGILSPGEWIGCCIDRCRRGEYNIPNSMCLHRLEEYHRTTDIVIMIEARLLTTLSNGFESSEVDHRIDGMITEDRFEYSTITDISMIKSWALSCDILDPIEYRDITILEVIDDDNLMSSVLELNDRMRSDISSSSSKEEF